MKKSISIIITLLLLLSLCLPASAAYVSAGDAVETLETLGLVKGTGNGFAPERSATRAEALTMLVRLLGREAEALAVRTPCPFDDGGWAASYLTYAWENGLILGKTKTQFGSGDAVQVRDYLTMVLRALGYSTEAGDFSWADSIVFSDRLGLTHGEYDAGSAFLREDLALVSYTALTMKLKGSGQTLIEKLYLDGAVSAAALKSTRLAGALSAGKPVYSASEIHERSASAVLYVETYRDEAQWKADKSDSHGSGFFVTGDGVALMSWHELDGYEYARVTTLDGRRYEVTGVLFYDPLWDVAAVRVSKTDLNGRTVRFFPYLDIGDSDAVCNGDAVYAVSNPLGMIDNITDGVVSNRSRNVDDPAYLCLQVSTPIAPGSSGGALLNRHGEAIGILYASFTRGQNMNLAVPLNCIAGVSLTGNGKALAEVQKLENEKKAVATLTADKTSLSLKYDESAEILVTHGCPGSAVIQYEIKELGIVGCEWGEFVTKHTVPLTITGIGNGEADVEISFADGSGNENSRVTIHVTVTGAPAEDDGETEYGTTEK